MIELKGDVDSFNLKVTEVAVKLHGIPGFVCVPLKYIKAEDLARMCDDFRNDIFKEANIDDPSKARFIGTKE